MARDVYSLIFHKLCPESGGGSLPLTPHESEREFPCEKSAREKNEFWRGKCLLKTVWL